MELLFRSPEFNIQVVTGTNFLHSACKSLDFRDDTPCFLSLFIVIP